MGRNIKLKKIILMLFLLLLTGCDADYTLYMNEDESFKESITIQDINGDFLEIDKHIKDTIEQRMDKINDTLDHPIRNLKIFKGKDFSGVKDSHTYINYEELNYSPYLQNVNAKISLVKEDNTTLYIFNNFDYLIYLEETEYDPIALKNIRIHIDIPFEVLDTNADVKEGSIYTWNIDPTVQNRTMYVRYNENKVVRKKTWSKNTIIAIILGSVLTIVGILVVVGWYIIKKNNEM